MSSLLVYKPANLFIIVSKYFFPIPLLKISSVTISADVFLYQPEFPWLNSSNIYLLTLLNTDTFSFASHLSPAILHSGLNSFPLFQFRFIIFQVHKKVSSTLQLPCPSILRGGVFFLLQALIYKKDSDGFYIFFHIKLPLFIRLAESDFFSDPAKIVLFRQIFFTEKFYTVLNHCLIIVC